MKPDIVEKLAFKHPDLIVGDDVLLDQDEEEILVWNEEKLGPTPESVQQLEIDTDPIELDMHKDRKIKELADAAVSSLSDVFPDGGTDEALYVAFMHIEQIAAALNITVDPRVTAVTETAGKALGKKEQVLNATTMEQVDDIVWEVTDG